MKNKILIILFCCYIFGFGLFSLVDTDKEISFTERRKLDKVPKFELTNEYVDKLDSYLVDQFPLRDEYRGVKASYNYYVLNMLVNNNICSSKREAREFLQAGSITINGDKVVDENTLITNEFALGGSFVIVRRGKKKYFVGKFLNK